MLSGAPRWRDNKPPDDVVAAEDEPAELACHANGQPRPTVSWSVNGIELSGSAINRHGVVINRTRVCYLY